MRRENLVVNTVWIGNRLSLLERLTIKLLQKHGHEVHLWAYGPIENVPEDVVLQDASRIWSVDNVFEYAGVPFEGIPNRGIGSYAHWSDIFQLALLSKIGGLYSQLDVAYLAPLDFPEEYVFVQYAPFSTFLMKCPKGSLFATTCFDNLSKIVNKEAAGTYDWVTTLWIIRQHAHDLVPDCPRFILDESKYMDVGNRQEGPFFEDVAIPEEVRMIHWSNATHNQRKDSPIPGSVYHRMLVEVGLV